MSRTSTDDKCQKKVEDILGPRQIEWNFIKDLILWKYSLSSIFVFVSLSVFISTTLTSGYLRYIVLFTTSCVLLLYVAMQSDTVKNNLDAVIQQGKTTEEEKKSFEANFSYQNCCKTIAPVLETIMLTFNQSRILLQNMAKSKVYCVVVLIYMGVVIILLGKFFYYFGAVLSWCGLLISLWLPTKYYGIHRIMFEMIKQAEEGAHSQASPYAARVKQTLPPPPQPAPSLRTFDSAVPSVKPWLAQTSPPPPQPVPSLSTLDSTWPVKPLLTQTSPPLPQPVPSLSTLDSTWPSVKPLLTQTSPPLPQPAHSLTTLDSTWPWVKPWVTQTSSPPPQPAHSLTTLDSTWPSVKPWVTQTSSPPPQPAHSLTTLDSTWPWVKPLLTQTSSPPPQPAHSLARPETRLALPICDKFLMGQCTEGNQCSKLHCKMPYQWMCNMDSIWRMMNEDDNEKLEMAFCNPNIKSQNVSLSLNGSFLESGISKIYCVDFVDMKLTDGNIVLRRLSTKSQKELPECPFSTKWCWFWEDSPGNFKEYQLNQELEKHYLEGSSFYDFEVGHHQYRLFFKETPMYQKNMNPIYYTQREVRRRPRFGKCTKEPRKLAVFEEPTVPLRWKRMEDKQEYMLVKLEKEHEEYKKMKSLFLNTMEDITFTIKSIERLQNPFMFGKFERKKSQMEKMAKNPNERHLFHGTSRENVESICKNNLDWRLYGTSTGNLYGQGAYFATHASYSHRYSRPDEKGIHCMFIARVLVGSFIRGQENYRTPPPKDAKKGDLFDSCVDDVKDPKIFVVFDVDQYYPEYLVKYRLKSQFNFYI